MTKARIWKKIAIGIALTGGISGLAYVGVYAYYFWLLSKMFYERGITAVSAKNDRGDKAVIAVDSNFHPYRTEVTLRPAHAWFSTELLTATNKDFSIGLKWRGDDHLEVQLDLGPGAAHSTPVAHLGPITVIYRWGGPEAPPPDADIDPYVSCPAPYASAYYAKCESETPAGSGR